jgi:hypothetical protein
VRAAAGGRDDHEAAFAAGFDQHPVKHLPGLLSQDGELIIGEFVLPGRAAGEFRVRHRRALDAVEDVHAAARGGFHVAVDDALPHVQQPVIGEQVLIGGQLGFADGAALELEHLQAAGHCAADEPESVVAAGAEPCGELLTAWALGLVAVPGRPVRPGLLGVGCPQPVASGGDYAASGIVECERLGEQIAAHDAPRCGRPITQQEHSPSRSRWSSAACQARRSRYAARSTTPPGCMVALSVDVGDISTLAAVLAKGRRRRLSGGRGIAVP